MTSQVDSLYRIAGQLHRRSGGPAWLPALWFLTDSVRVKDPEAVIESLPAGCGVIFRDYERPDRAGLAHSLSALTRERDCLFLVAGDAALAKACRADGVHLPEHRLEQAKMIRQNGIRLMTAATLTKPR